ncbi:restriction endonuclease subunit S [Pseudoxanthomonas mexicana]|uniref:restriction endonuclease subunit S n=1 Tax=Pseudoxanthomonas mexicana TaxID=128785 RepID=UPI001FD72203|nr:restriction endonuclease subunit S [Pseudoxanthomonas mexicana]UOV01168.1 restriction endonuclease subunit S [Pseudoxanthomonas mexicana]
MAKQGAVTAMPRLRFPEFRGAGAWSEAKLDSLIDTVSPPAKLPSSSYLATGKFPIIDQSQDAICGWTDDPQVVIEKPLPLIVFGDHTCVLKFVARPFAQGADGIKILAAKPTISIDYLFHSLNHQPLVMEDYKRHFSTLKERKVFFPSVESGEQQKIADCLTSLDEVIAAQRRKVEALKAHKRGLMQQLFPREDETRPRLRFPEFQDAPEWVIGKAGDVVEVLQGYGFPERLQGSKEGEFPFYKVSDISACVDAGGMLLSDAKNHIDAEVLRELRAKPLPVGTTVFAKIGEAIRSNKRAITTKLSLVDNNAAGVKAIEGVADDYFVYYLWSQLRLIEYSGGVVPAVNKSAIEQIQVCYPGIEEQQRIAACLYSLDTNIAVASNHLLNLRSHKQGLMQGLFPMASGE